MMSKINAPIHSYKTPQIYYQRPKIWQKMFRNFFTNFFLTNETRYINSDFNLGSSSFFNKLAITNISHSHLNIAIFFLTIFFLTIFFLPMFPNHGKSGEPNWEHNLLNKHVVAMLTLSMGILILKSTIPIYRQSPVKSPDIKTL